MANLLWSQHQLMGTCMSASQLIKYHPRALFFLSAGSCHGNFSLLSLPLLSGGLFLPVAGKGAGLQPQGPARCWGVTHRPTQMMLLAE